MFYVAKTPNWVKKLFPGRIWEMPKTKKAIYLTFDDGPLPLITPFVLDELRKFDAKATFFCIGKNVMENQAIFDRMIKEGHAVGNHTYNHPDGWKTNSVKYLQNILDARKFIDSGLTYTNFFASLVAGEPTYILFRTLGELVSYCDVNAARKNEFNENADKRTVAKAGIHQNDWVKILLKYKIHYK